MNFILHMHVCFVVEFGSPELNWRSTFFKSWGQIYILWDNASVEQADHTFIYVLLRDWWRVLQILLFFKVLLVSLVSEISGSHHTTKRLFSIVGLIFL